MSVFYAYQYTWRLFDPIIGKANEMANHEGIAFIFEQVSHHPSLSVEQAENFTYDVTSKLKTKFLENSLNEYPIEKHVLFLKKWYGFRLVSFPIKVKNLIFGQTWFDSSGEMIMTNLIIGNKVMLYFQTCG